MSVSENPNGPNLIINGGFENYADCPNTSSCIQKDNKYISPWYMAKQSTEFELDLAIWPAAEGGISIDLSSTIPNSIAQNVSTDLGSTYRVTFQLYHSPCPGPPNRTGTLEITGTPTYSFSTLAKTDWTTESVQFRATSANTVLTFSSSTSNACGPVIDDVKMVLIASAPPTTTTIKTTSSISVASSTPPTASTTASQSSSANALTTSAAPLSSRPNSALPPTSTSRTTTLTTIPSNSPINLLPTATTILSFIAPIVRPSSSSNANQVSSVMPISPSPFPFSTNVVTSSATMTPSPLSVTSVSTISPPIKTPNNIISNGVMRHSLCFIRTLAFCAILSNVFF